MKTLEARKNDIENLRRIGIREFVRNTKTISKQLKRGEAFVLCSNGEEIALIRPMSKEKNKYSKKDFLDAIVGIIKYVPGLSNEEIDAIIYDG